MDKHAISQKLFNLGDRIGLSHNSNMYPVIEKISSDGLSLYFENGEYHYVSMERGNEIKHYTSNDSFEILYYIFKDITFRLAQDYELHHRLSGEDSRKIIFNKQLELLEKIHKKYRELRELEIDKILDKYPYK